jgi:1,2-diacylglycerol 3-alpha-glucosyltransferase
MNGVTGMVALLKAGLEERGHRVILVVPFFPEAECTVPSLPLIPSIRLRLPLASGRSLSRLFLREAVDLVHTHTEGPLGHASRKAAAEAGIPLLHTFHTFYEHYVHYTLLGRIPAVRRLTGSLLPGFWARFLAPYGGVIAPSRGAEIFLNAAAPRVPCVYLPNAVQPVEPGGALRSRFGIEPGDKLILSVGRIAREKRSSELLRAFLPYLKSRKGVKMVLAGGGGLLSALRREVARAGMEDRVFLPGYLGREEIFDLYGMASVFVTASLSENLPLSLLEAASCALPIAARRDPNLETLVMDGENGLTAESDDRLAAETMLLLDDEPRRKLCGEASLRLSGNFSPQRHLDEIERNYFFLISTP